MTDSSFPLTKHQTYLPPRNKSLIQWDGFLHSRSLSFDMALNSDPAYQPKPTPFLQESLINHRNFLMRTKLHMDTEVFLLSVNTHTNGPGHPESPERLFTLESLFRRLAQTGLTILCNSENSRSVEDVDSFFRIYEKVHSRDYLSTLLSRKVPPGTVIPLDPDTGLSNGSREAIMACGASLNALLQHRQANGGNYFLAERPPGHHALRDRAMGFCLVNHTAALAQNIHQTDPDSRVAVLDFDVHHGNGTEDSLRGLDRCLFISTHQYPFYPGTGSDKNNRREADGGGLLNLPLPEGIDDEDYRTVLKEKILPRLENFRPTDLIVSAGFDGHRDDPLGGWLLTEEIYLDIGRSLLSLECRFIASILEGGYNLTALSCSVEAYLNGIRRPSQVSRRY